MAISYITVRHYDMFKTIHSKIVSLQHPTKERDWKQKIQNLNYTKKADQHVHGQSEPHSSRKKKSPQIKTLSWTWAGTP